MSRQFLAVTYSPANGFTFALQDTAHNGYHLTADLRTTLGQDFKLEAYLCASAIVPWPNEEVATRIVQHIALAAGLNEEVGRRALAEWLERVAPAPTPTPPS